MLEKINDIKLALNSNSYLSALALSLTLPDICGKIEYPHYKYENGRRNVGKQYATWFDDWVNHYYADPSGWTNDYSKAKNPIFTGEMCYSLRCSFLHDGNSDINYWGDKEDKDFNYIYEFRLAVGGADQNGVSWENKTNNYSKVTKTKIVTVNIDSLCKYICQSAEKYYRVKDPTLFKDHKINFIDFNNFKTN
jgi:hypothetical protein